MRIAIQRLGILLHAPLFRGGVSLAGLLALVEIVTNWAGFVQWAGGHVIGAIAFASSPFFGWFVLLAALAMIGLGIRQAGFMFADAENKRAAELRSVEKLIRDATLLPALMAQKPGIEDRIIRLTRIIDGATESLRVAKEFAHPKMQVNRSHLPPLLGPDYRFDLQQECNRFAPDFLEKVPELPVWQTVLDYTDPERLIRPEDNVVLFGQIRAYVAAFEAWLIQLRRFRDAFSEKLSGLDRQINAEIQRLNGQA